MRSIRAWLLRAAALFHGRSLDEDLAAELESHLQLHVDDNIRAGMTPEASRRHALIALGGVDATKERYRDRRGLPFADALRQDVVYAVRTLRGVSVYRRHAGSNATPQNSSNCATCRSGSATSAS